MNVRLHGDVVVGRVEAQVGADCYVVCGNERSTSLACPGEILIDSVALCMNKYVPVNSERTGRSHVYIKSCRCGVKMNTTSSIVRRYCARRNYRKQNSPGTRPSRSGV